MNTRFPAQPLCEQCGKEPADTFACFHDEGNKWKFVGPCCADRMAYDIPIGRFFQAPASTVGRSMRRRGWTGRALWK